MVTKKMFTDIKRIANSGHTAASAKRATEAKINEVFGKIVEKFVEGAVDLIIEQTAQGVAFCEIAAPNFGSMALDNEVRSLLLGHLERRGFSVQPHSGGLTVQW